MVKPSENTEVVNRNSIPTGIDEDVKVRYEWKFVTKVIGFIDMATVAQKV